VIRADDRPARAAQPPAQREVIRRVHLEPYRAGGDVPRAHAFVDARGGSDQEPAALVRRCVARVRRERR
jgi:hypothetical protein